MKKIEMQILRSKAKDLAEEMTRVNVQTKGLHVEANIIKEHDGNIVAIRQMLVLRGIVT